MPVDPHETKPKKIGVFGNYDPDAEPEDVIDVAKRRFDFNPEEEQ